MQRRLQTFHSIVASCSLLLQRISLSCFARFELCTSTLGRAVCSVYLLYKCRNPSNYRLPNKKGSGRLAGEWCHGLAGAWIQHQRSSRPQISFSSNTIHLLRQKHRWSRPHCLVSKPTRNCHRASFITDMMSTSISLHVIHCSAVGHIVAMFILHCCFWLSTLTPNSLSAPMSTQSFVSMLMLCRWSNHTVYIT